MVQAYRELLSADPAVALASFDVFDTLIQRVTATPGEVFALLEPRVAELTGGRLRTFQTARTLAARLARRALPRRDSDNTLAEIYQTLIGLDLLSAGQARLVQDWEIEAEKRVLVRREAGCRCLAAARERGLRVALMSDMYLPAETLREILAGLGIADYDALYLSSAERATKYYGGLWDLMLAREGVAPEAVLHLGDHAISDGRVPAERGLKALRLPPAREEYQGRSPIKSRHFKGFPDSAFPAPSHFPALTQGLTQARFFADPDHAPDPAAVFGGDPFHLGYAALGPLLAGFGLWLARAAREDGADELFFLARDGAALKRVFDILAPEAAPGVRTRYLYNSRKTTLLAGLRNAADILEVVMGYFQPVSLARYLDDKFGLRADEAPAGLFRKHGLPLEAVVGMADRDRFLPLILDLAPLIYKKAAQTRAGLAAYWAEAGFPGHGRPAVVDVGLSGFIQATLADLADRPDLAGSYLFLDQRAARPHREGRRMRSFFEPFLDKFSTQFKHKYQPHYFESLFKPGDEGSLDRAEADENGRPRLIFRPLTDSRNRRALPVIQDGAAAFTRDLAAHFGPWLAGLPVNPYSAARPYLTFFDQPTAPDARILEGLVVDDTYCGTDRKYFLNPGGRGDDSYWPEGAEALRNDERAGKDSGTAAAGHR